MIDNMEAKPIETFLKVLDLDDKLSKKSEVIVHTFVYKARGKREEKLIGQGDLPDSVNLMIAFFRVKSSFPIFELEDSMKWDYQNKTVSFRILERIK